MAMNVALYQRFARRSTAQVKAILATILVFAGTLAATGIATSAPLRLMGGATLCFYVAIVAELIALLPEPPDGGDDASAP